MWGRVLYFSRGMDVKRNFPKTSRVRENVLALKRRRRLVEFYFVVALGAVAVMLFLYTHVVVGRLRHEFRVTSFAYATVTTLLASDLADPAMDEIILRLARDIGRTMKFPSIVTDAAGTPQAWSPSYNKKLGKDPDANIAQMKKFAAELDRQHKPFPIIRYARDPESGLFAGSVFGHFHFGEPNTIRLLYWVPALELLLIVGFTAAGVVAYQRLKRAEQQALWAGMARETAHQLGTPVSSLMGWLEILKERCAQNDAVAEPLAEMAADIRRLEKVAARFEEIGAPVKLEERDVVPLLGNAVAYGQRRAPAEARLKFEVISPPSLAVPHSPVLIEWVIENFVKNAVDATRNLPPGEGKITVTVRAEKDYVAISVADNGVGIAPEEFPHIFTPGFTTKEKGWGLGLSLVKRIVEDVHHGRLEVRSEVGRGATFTAYLPRA